MQQSKHSADVDLLGKTKTFSLYREHYKLPCQQHKQHRHLVSRVVVQHTNHESQCRNKISHNTYALATYLWISTQTRSGVFCRIFR